MRLNPEGILSLHEVMCFICLYITVCRAGLSMQHNRMHLCLVNNSFTSRPPFQILLHTDDKKRSEACFFFSSVCLLCLHLIQFASAGHLCKDWRLSGATTSHSGCTYSHHNCWNRSLSVWSCSNYHHITSVQVSTLYYIHIYSIIGNLHALIIMFDNNELLFSKL